MDTIRHILCKYSVWNASIAVASISSVFLMWFYRSKKMKRYTTWKRETINLGVYKSEREFSNDELLQAIYDENLQLDPELKKLLKKS